MNSLISNTDWIWILPMIILNIAWVYCLVDGVLFNPGTGKEMSLDGEINDRRVLGLSEVQRCCVVVGFLGTLLGTYKVLLGIAQNGGAQTMLQNMFQGMATAILSSIVGCVMFLFAAGAEHIVAGRWSSFERSENVV